MKKFLLLIALIPCFVQAQQTYFTPGIPPSSLSFTPTFRFKNGSVDSLNNIYLAIGNKWYQVYTAAQANARFTGGGGGASWGSITGTLSAQIDLNTALNGKLSKTFSSNQTITLGGDTLKFGTHGTFIADSAMAAVGNQGFASMLPASFRLGKNLTTWLSITGGSSANTITGNPITITPKVSFAVNPALGATSTVGYVPTATNTSGDWSWTAPAGGSTGINGLNGTTNIGLGGTLASGGATIITGSQNLILQDASSGTKVQYAQNGNSINMFSGDGTNAGSISLTSNGAQLQYTGYGYDSSYGSQYIKLEGSDMKVFDGIYSLGLQYASNYTTNQRLQRLSIPSVNTVIALADSVKATITPGTGTVTSITPGAGFLSHTPITASGTMNIDTTSTIQTIANFKPLGSTYWLSKTATSNSTLTTLSALSLPYSQLTGTPSLSSYLTAIGVTTANGVSGTSSGGTTPNLTIALGNITPTSISTTIKPATIYQTATGTAGTDSIMVKHSGGVVNAIAGNYYQVAGSYALQSTTISAGTGLSGGGSLAANRTLSADTTVLQTVLNFKPLGSTYWLLKTATTLPGSFTASSLTSFGPSPTLNTAVLTGLPTGTGVSNTSSASTLAARDANSNLYANAFHPSFTTTVSSATPIVLTVGSTQVQEITGSTAQTVTLPVASTLTTGWTVIITSASSATVTVQSSGGNTVATLVNGNTATIWCVLASGTGLASWDRSLGSGSFTGTGGSMVLATAPTLSGATLNGTTTAATIAATLVQGTIQSNSGGLNVSNLYASAVAGFSAQSGATLLYGGATTTQGRAILGNGSTALSLTGGNSYANVDIGQGATITVPNATTSTWITQLAITPLPTITKTGTGSVTNTATAFFSAASSAGTNNYTAYFDTGNLQIANGNLTFASIGNGIAIKEGTNAAMGTGTLASGTLVVSNTRVTANSRIFLTDQGGTVTNLGSLYISARSAGTSFTVSSSNVLDASTFAWVIIEPAP